MAGRAVAVTALDGLVYDPDVWRKSPAAVQPRGGPASAGGDEGAVRGVAEA